MDWRTLLNDEVTKTVGAVLGVLFIAGILIEYLLSMWKHKPYVRSEYLIINLCIAFLQQLTDFANKAIFIFAFVFVQTHWSISKLLHLPIIEAVNPFSPFNALALLNYFLVLVLADFCQYWLHRFSHEINILWAGHVTHHSNEEYNLGVAVRQNALEGIYTWVFFMPLAFLGIPWQMFISAYAISLLWQFLVHTRWINKLGVLEYFMSTPSHHRVHHGRNPQYIDKNYGAFFIIWDKLFGTFEPEGEPVDYGITEPLKTQNPVWSNIHHHADIARRVWNAATWREKWKWLVGMPSHIYRSEKNNSVAHHSFIILPLKKLYVFINFVLVAVAAFYVLNQSIAQGRVTYFIAMSIFVVFSFSVFTALLEQKKWADYAEVLRLFAVGVSGVVLLWEKQTVGIALILCTLLLFCLTLFVASDYNKQHSAVTLR